MMFFLSCGAISSTRLLLACNNQAVQNPTVCFPMCVWAVIPTLLHWQLYQSQMPNLEQALDRWWKLTEVVQPVISWFKCLHKLPLLYLQSVETSPCLVQPKLCSLMKTFALSCFNDSLGTEVECKKPGSMNNVPEGDRCLALKAKLWHQPHLQGYRTGSPLCRWVQAWDSPTGERHKMTEPQNGLGCKKP